MPSRNEPFKRKSGNAKVVKTALSSAKPFAIVGFGASAGGLEAFSTVLQHLDDNLGMAYVLVMHLSPNHKSALAEIVQLKTRMKVHTVTNGMEVQPDNVYVIPPNASMSIVDGHLKLAPREITINGNFAVDYFLTALASVYKNNSIGVILSGTATDGTLGLKAIKAEGGITFVQDNSAKFPGMPKSAHESGYADFILSPERIALELAQLAKIPYTVLSTENIEKNHAEKLDEEKDSLQRILYIVKSKTGIDFFTQYKQASIYRRVVRRAVLHKLQTLDEYISMLTSNDKEVNELYNDFLINVTAFFRDRDFYNALNFDVLPNLLKNRETKELLRIWVAGCATGEEAYSVAITVAEFIEKHNINIPYQVFASDLDSNAVEKARTGIYSVSSVQHISSGHLKKFFKKIDGHYQIVKSIREACIFSQHNLLKDPPFSRMDMISCQNVLIYLESEPQQKILQTFHYALKPNGYLFLGKSENIGSSSSLFEGLDKKIKLYSRKAAGTRSPEIPAHINEVIQTRKFLEEEARSVHDLDKEISKTILAHYVLPCVVVNEHLNIVQFFGNTSHYLSPVVGKASFNILKMIREDLLIDLRTLIQLSKKSGKAASKEGIIIRDKDNTHELGLEVLPRKIGAALFFLVVFKENGASGKPRKRGDEKLRTLESQKERLIINLEEELGQSRELIRTTNEEYESTYEELQANNEQILSSNEELQSVNEELETSKEELQSANEELTTINEELQKRNAELKESQNYAKAIVDTVNSPFLVLSSNLQVRVANKSFYETFQLEPERAEGSFIYELGEHSWDIISLREHLNDLLGKRTNYKEFKFEHYFPKLGDMSFLVSAYRLIKEDGAKETLILLAFHNIGELAKANLELRNVNAQLEQFIYVSSHDLQEPLRKIRTFVAYVNDYPTTDVFIRDYLFKIDKVALRLTNLLRDLLSYSSLLQKRSRSSAKVELNKTLEDILVTMEHAIREKEAKITVGQLPTIVADPNQMNVLFTNLIDNSLKFNLGTPIINVTSKEVTSREYEELALNRERNYACIQIADNGVGFNQKYISKIFLLFQRLYDKKDLEGTGLGLSMSKQIVEDHGGRIIAEGRENEGATFSVFLPRV